MLRADYRDRCGGGWRGTRPCKSGLLQQPAVWFLALTICVIVGCSDAIVDLSVNCDLAILTLCAIANSLVHSISVGQFKCSTMIRIGPCPLPPTLPLTSNHTMLFRRVRHISCGYI